MTVERSHCEESARLPDPQAFLTLSEVIGHLDLLVNEGLVREMQDGGVVRYEAR